MHIWALTYFEEVGHITECCYFDAMNFFWSDYCSPKWELEVQHSGHMWVQCLPLGTKWQCMPIGMKVQHSGHMSAMRLKFPFLNVSTFKSAQVPWTYFFQVWDAREKEQVKASMPGPHICGDALDIKVIVNCHKLF